MSNAVYAHFMAPTVTVKKGNVEVKPDADLPKTGQSDGTAEKEENSDYKAAAGWFRVVAWDYGVCCNVESGAGVSVGNVTDSYCSLVVYHGENTAVAYRAAFNRAPFDLELHVTERLGQEKNKMNCKLIFRGCVFKEVRSCTGDPRTKEGGVGTNTVVEHKEGNDTKELDLYRFVYQKLDINTFGKECHCSLQGSTT